MSISWPSDLPQAPLFGSWQEEMEDNRASFAPDVGPPIDRPRVTLSSDLCNFRMSVTGDQKRALKVFYRTDLKDGSLQFENQHFRDPGSETLSWKIVAPPSFTERANDLYLVTLKLRLMP